VFRGVRVVPNPLATPFFFRFPSSRANAAARVGVLIPEAGPIS
jgi:hypothetical protein